MTEQYLVVEVITAKGQVENLYIGVESDPVAVANGFRRLAEDGTKATGIYSFVERVAGVITARYTPQRPPIWARDGFRTASAFVRV